MPYVEAVFAACGAGRKMDDADTIIGVELRGPERTKPACAAQTQSVKDALMKTRKTRWIAAHLAAPTIFVGDEMFFGKDRLRDVEDEIIRQAGAALGVNTFTAKANLPATLELDGWARVLSGSSAAP